MSDPLMDPDSELRKLARAAVADFPPLTPAQQAVVRSAFGAINTEAAA